ncbi:MAG: Gfo/Idh/MocA family oxidoreductase [Elusimicrobia bacterium]|nr:Gfo/Idh/MocA family oxidoreductase [Elusimicrobiota bacterium]
MSETPGSSLLNNGKESSLRYGVIGLGRMGTLHLEVLKTLTPKVCVRGISDTDAKRIRRAKHIHPEARHFSDYKQMLGHVDAVSKILWAGQGTSTHLHIGHIERFNPTIVKAKELIARPLFIEVVRSGPYEPRVHDIGVILDLMIHDLDLILWILSDLDVQLEEYSGQGLSLISPHEDLAKVRLRFKERKAGYPVFVDLTANRLSFERLRKMRIFQEESYLSLDLLNHKLRYSKAMRLPLKSLKDITTIKPKLPATNPLRQELQHFIDSITQSSGHEVHPREAWDALELALQLNHSIDRKNLYSAASPYAAAAR